MTDSQNDKVKMDPAQERQGPKDVLSSKWATATAKELTVRLVKPINAPLPEV